MPEKKKIEISVDEDIFKDFLENLNLFIDDFYPDDKGKIDIKADEVVS